MGFDEYVLLVFEEFVLQSLRAWARARARGRVAWRLNGNVNGNGNESWDSRLGGVELEVAIAVE